MTVEEMKAVDIRTVDRETLVDIRDVKIDRSLPLEERVRSFVEQIKNPYCVRCGEVYNSLSVCQASKKDLHTFFDNQFFYCDRRQFFACIAVLKELKLVRVEDEKIVEICREKKNLTDSFLYKRFSLK